MDLSNLKYKIYHHTAVYRTKTPQIYGVNRHHKKKYNMRSKMSSYVGYNGFIDVDGLFTQTRLIGEETAANIGHNCDIFAKCDSISICFALDGRKQVFNEAQEFTYKELEGGKIKLETLKGNLVTIPELKLERKFHREMQENRTCPGSLFTHEYMNDIIQGPVFKEDSQNGMKIKELQSQLDRMRKLVDALLKLITSLLIKK